jgi:hypothetical protein
MDTNIIIGGGLVFNPKVQIGRIGNKLEEKRNRK